MASSYDGTHPVGSLYTYDEIHLRGGEGIAQKERLVHSPHFHDSCICSASHQSRPSVAAISPVLHACQFSAIPSPSSPLL